MTTKPKYQAQL